MYTRREESTKEALEEPEVTFEEAVGGLGDQVEEEKPSKIPSIQHIQRLGNFKFKLKLFYF